MMTVDHVVPSIENASAGPSQSIPAMCNGLVRAGVAVTLHVLEKLPPTADEFLFRAQTYPWTRCPVRAGASREMKRMLRRRSKETDIIHNHSLWMFPNVYPGAAVSGTDCKLVCSPRGCLTEYSLSRSKWKKRLMWFIGQGRMMRRVDMFHATAQSEYDDIRRLGFRQPVVVLPNGITSPSIELLSDLSSRNSSQGGRTLLYLSRIHSEKRLDLLLQAWGPLETKFPNWNLKVYGPNGHAFAQSMIKLSRSLGHRRVSFPGEVRGDAKWQAYVSADLFILPTRTENFGMAVAESLSCGVPVITTKGAPWEGLVARKCGWWVDESVDAISHALSCAMSLPPEELVRMGVRGREWMKQDYDWDVLSVKMKSAYEWLLDPAHVMKPEWLYL